MFKAPAGLQQSEWAWQVFRMVTGWKDPMRWKPIRKIISKPQGWNCRLFHLYSVLPRGTDTTSDNANKCAHRPNMEAMFAGRMDKKLPGGSFGALRLHMNRTPTTGADFALGKGWTGCSHCLRVIGVALGQSVRRFSVTSRRLEGTLSGVCVIVP